MANLDLSRTTTSFYMTYADAVAFATVDGALSTHWSYISRAGDDLEFEGQGLTYDLKGHPLTGTVNSIAIDLGHNDFFHPDIVVTGINVEAATLDDGQQSFWRFLEGDDVITLPSGPGNAMGFDIVGDALQPRAGATTGGKDVIFVGDRSSTISGDVFFAGSPTAPAYRGGADEIRGLATDAQQYMVGDARVVRETGKLVGGNDSIFINSSDIGSFAAGDAESVGGTVDHRGYVLGGNDYIEAGAGSRAKLIGDVYRQAGNSVVRGGNDELNGGEQGEQIYGDVYDAGDGRLIGGDDTIRGNGGHDALVGDVGTRTSNGKVVAGNDIIYGGDGGDYIAGDVFSGNLVNVTGGNDELHGDAGNDLLIGQTGNDILDGGTSADEMIGGTGDDAYIVDDAGDTMKELAGEGIDIVKTLITNVVLGDNIENLTSLFIGNFTVTGNGLDNTMSAGGGDDMLDGGAGNDILIGYSGGDTLIGGAGNDILLGGSSGAGVNGKIIGMNGSDTLSGGDGFDTASYEGALQRVKVALDGSFASEGDALNDSFSSIEGLTGSNFDDVLRGDSGINKLEGRGGADLLAGGDGNDVVVGGAGKDVLSGGAGNDRFDYLALSDAGDTIRDFRNATGNNDALRFDGDVFGGLAKGALAAKFFVANATGVAATIDQHFIYETDTGILRYDANGSAAGGVTVIATLTGAPGLSAGDFFII